MNITVLGGGAWGTAIAISAARNHAPQSVCLWARNAKQIEALNIDAENKQYLPAIPLPDGLLLESDFQKALGCLGSDDVLVIATPMSGLSQILEHVLTQAKHPFNILYLCKGL
jgi:glycerol-3-phosphate dehydrogenase (NAD(P)+)